MAASRNKQGRASLKLVADHKDGLWYDTSTEDNDSITYVTLPGGGLVASAQKNPRTAATPTKRSLPLAASMSPSKPGLALQSAVHLNLGGLAQDTTDDMDAFGELPPLPPAEPDDDYFGNDDFGNSVLYGPTVHAADPAGEDRDDSVYGARIVLPSAVAGPSASYGPVLTSRVARPLSKTKSQYEDMSDAFAPTLGEEITGEDLYEDVDTPALVPVAAQCSHTSTVSTRMGLTPASPVSKPKQQQQQRQRQQQPINDDEYDLTPPPPSLLVGLLVKRAPAPVPATAAIDSDSDDYDHMDAVQHTATSVAPTNNKTGSVVLASEDDMYDHMPPVAGVSVDAAQALVEPSGDDVYEVVEHHPASVKRRQNRAGSTRAPLIAPARPPSLIEHMLEGGALTDNGTSDEFFPSHDQVYEGVGGVGAFGVPPLQHKQQASPAVQEDVGYNVMRHGPAPKPAASVKSVSSVRAVSAFVDDGEYGVMHHQPPATVLKTPVNIPVKSKESTGAVATAAAKQTPFAAVEQEMYEDIEHSAQPPSNGVQEMYEDVDFAPQSNKVATPVARAVSIKVMSSSSEEHSATETQDVYGPVLANKSAGEAVQQNTLESGHVSAWGDESPVKGSLNSPAPNTNQQQQQQQRRHSSGDANAVPPVGLALFFAMGFVFILLCVALGTKHWFRIDVGDLTAYVGLFETVYGASENANLLRGVAAFSVLFILMHCATMVVLFGDLFLRREFFPQQRNVPSLSGFVLALLTGCAFVTAVLGFITLMLFAKLQHNLRGGSVAAGQHSFILFLVSWLINLLVLGVLCFSVTDRKSALVPMQSDSAGMRQLALRPSVSGRTEMVDNPLAARSYENTRPFAF